MIYKRFPALRVPKADRNRGSVIPRAIDPEMLWSGAISSSTSVRSSRGRSSADFGAGLDAMLTANASA